MAFRARLQEVDLGQGELRSEVHVRVVRVVEELEVIDFRDGRIEFGQEQRRAEAAVADDQIRPQVRMLPARLIDPVGVPDRVLERPAAIMGCLPGTSLRLVRDLPDAIDLARRCRGDERTRPAQGADQVSRDVPELRREILVDEEDVHLCPLPAVREMGGAFLSGSGHDTPARSTRPRTRPDTATAIFCHVEGLNPTFSALAEDRPEGQNHEARLLRPEDGLEVGDAKNDEEYRRERP
jgi:hypothetical protein